MGGPAGELVGVGSFGQVFGGVLVKTGRRIAVKEVSLSGPQREAGLEQARALQVEIQILSTLDHPNIVKYLGGECVSECVSVCVCACVLSVSLLCVSSCPGFAYNLCLQTASVAYI